MDGTLKTPAVGTIDTAILLASSGVFDLAAGSDQSPVGALTRLGGMTLFQRTVFTLQRGGISRILILAGREEASLRSLIHGDDRIHAAIRWLPVREFPPLDAQTWEVLASEMQGACLILGCQMVCTPSLIESFRTAGREGRAVVATGRPGDWGWDANPGVRLQVDRHRSGLRPRVVFCDRQYADLVPAADTVNGFASAVDLVVLPVRLFGISGAWRTPATGPIRLALEQAAAEGTVRVLSAASYGYQDAREPGGRRKAERLLFRSLQTAKGSLDGMVDRYVNRKLSRLFSRLFLQWSVSPNTITVLSLLIGLLGAACFATGSYPLGMLGAALFQFAVILDCCDGEVARLTFAESPFGQALDLVADNIVHMAIFAGIAWGAYQEGPWHARPLPLILGGIAVVSNGVSLWAVNRVLSLKAHPGHWQALALVHQTRCTWLLERLANRDFSVVVAVFACLGALSWFLWLGAVGASLFALLMAWSLHQALRPHQA